MTVIEVKKHKQQREVSLYHRTTRDKSFYHTFINSDYNSLLQLFFDLYREGFPVFKAAKRFVEIKENKEKEDDWLF